MISSNTMQVRYKLGFKMTSARVVIENKETSCLQVAKPTTNERVHTLQLSNKILNPAEIRINGPRANVLIHPCTVCTDQISAQFCYMHHRPTDEMPPTSSFTAMKLGKSTITKKATVAVDVQGHREIRTFLVTNLMHCNAIIGHLMLHHLYTGINIKDKSVFIQPNEKIRFDLHILQKVTDTPVMQAAATFTEEYDSLYD